MNKYILADMATERLTRETAMTAKSLPDQIKTLEADLPKGKMRFETELYQSEKLKKITIGRRSLGDASAGTVVMLMSQDEYDFPFVLADIAFEPTGKGLIAAGFQLRPIVNDVESMKKYIDPFQAWYTKIDNFPSEPIYLNIGDYLKSHPAPLNYAGKIPCDYSDEVLKLTEQFFDILLDIYHRAEPVTDAQRRKQMDDFRADYNRNILGDDYSGKILIKTFGLETTKLFYDYLVYL